MMMRISSSGLPAFFTYAVAPSLYVRAASAPMPTPSKTKNGRKYFSSASPKALNLSPSQKSASSSGPPNAWLLSTTLPPSALNSRT